jgi:hypothetical protein
MGERIDAVGGFAIIVLTKPGGRAVYVVNNNRRSRIDTRMCLGVRLYFSVPKKKKKKKKKEERRVFVLSVYFLCSSPNHQFAVPDWSILLSPLGEVRVCVSSV